jgi:FAD synthetase
MPGTMIFGTFDQLHPGHLSFFRQARRHGQPLIVVVGRDATVKKIKGRLPVQSETERLAAIADCPLVDIPVLGNLRYRFAHITRFKPDIICLGYDQKSSLTEELTRRFPNITIVRLKPYHPEIYKSSKIRHAQAAHRHPKPGKI